MEEPYNFHVLLVPAMLLWLIFRFRMYKRTTGSLLEVLSSGLQKLLLIWVDDTKTGSNLSLAMILFMKTTVYNSILIALVIQKAGKNRIVLV